MFTFERICNGITMFINKDNYSFDPAPRLKSNPMPVLFISLRTMSTNVIILEINTMTHLNLTKILQKLFNLAY